jgi:hypothetical protein
MGAHGLLKIGSDSLAGSLNPGQFQLKVPYEGTTAQKGLLEIITANSEKTLNTYL